MPFIRHLRDRRGYETIVVMHSYRQAPGAGGSRVLYLFRSPGHVKVGRDALDEEAREALEHTHPDLTFDWLALIRARDAMRAHSHQERPAVERRPSAGDRRREGAARSAEDDTPLGRSVGASRASAMRAAYRELLERVARRARTPEERDQLLDRARRLNPDEPTEAAAVQELTARFEHDRQAILAELPGRRRGRRGGRRHERHGSDADTTDDSAGLDGVSRERTTPDDGEDRESDDGFEIMAGEGEGDERAHLADSDSDEPPVDRDGDDRAPGAGQSDGPAAGDGLPGDREFRRD